MRLKFEPFNGRKRGFIDIFDEDTGKQVGHIRSNGVGFERFGGIDVSLFDEKYRATVHSYSECLGFERGVQSVLDHMTAFTDHSAEAQESTAA